jgi:hypothetical protein
MEYLQHLLFVPKTQGAATEHLPESFSLRQLLVPFI